MGSFGFKDCPNCDGVGTQKQSGLEKMERKNLENCRTCNGETLVCSKELHPKRTLGKCKKCEDDKTGRRNTISAKNFKK